MEISAARLRLAFPLLRLLLWHRRNSSASLSGSPLVWAYQCSLGSAPHIQSLLRRMRCCVFCSSFAFFFIEVCSPFKAVFCLLEQVLRGTLRLLLVCVSAPAGSVALATPFRRFPLWLGAAPSSSGQPRRFAFWPARILLLRGTDSSMAAFAWLSSALSDLIAR